MLTIDFSHVLKAPSEYYQNHNAHKAIIEKAEEDADFALAVLDPDILSALHLTKEHKVELFMTCSRHQSEAIQERIIENENLSAFAKEHKLTKHFFSLKLSRGRAESLPQLPLLAPLTPKSSARTSRSLPNSPNKPSKLFKEHLCQLRFAMVNKNEYLIDRKQIDERQKYMTLISYLWSVKVDGENYRQVCDTLNEMLSLFDLPDAGDSFSELCKIIDTVENDIMISSLSLPMDDEDSSSKARWFDKCMKSCRTYESLIADFKASLPETFDDLDLDHWNKFTIRLNEFISHALILFSQDESTSDLAKTTVKIHMLCAQINVLRDIERELEPHHTLKMV